MANILEAIKKLTITFQNLVVYIITIFILFFFFFLLKMELVSLLNSNRKQNFHQGNHFYPNKQKGSSSNST